MITNKPFIVNNVTYPYIFWDGFFSELELNTIEEFCKNTGLGELTNVGVSINGSEAENDVRKSEVKFIHSGPDNAWLFDKLNMITTYVNNNFFNYELLGYEGIQYTEYNKKGDKYGWHIDMILGDNDFKDSRSNGGGFIIPRKLSFSLILSDSTEFKGGDFEFDIGSIQKAEQKRGRVIAFPSFIKHQVTPIKSGSRKSIVWWVLGPKFK